MIKNKFWFYATLATLSMSVGTQSSSMKVFADANTQEPVATSKTASNTGIQKGIWGNTPWTFNPNKHVFTLGDASKSETYITGTEGDDTTGDNSEPSILNDQREPFTIQIVGTVRLPSDCRGLFHDMYLENITYGNNGRLDTSDVIYMDEMFQGTQLQKFEAPNWDTNKLHDMTNMFMDCEKLESVNLSNWDNDKLTTMTGAFSGDVNLKTVNLENFKAPALKKMDSMFDDTPKLSVLTLSPSFFGTGSTDWDIQVHENGQKIPGSGKVAIGPGWMAVDKLHGGTIDNPQGTLYKNSQALNDGVVNAKARPSGPVTFVWQQDQYTLAVKKNQSITQGQKWNPLEAVSKATKNGQDDIHNGVKVAAVDSQKNSVNLEDTSKLPVGTYTLTYTNGQATPQALILTITSKSTPVIPSGSGSTTPVTPTPNTPSGSTTPSSSSSASTSSSAASSSATASTSSSATASSSSSNASVTLPDYAVTKGTVVYGINKLGLYKSTKFSKTNRKAWYAKKPRIYRPMFVVTGYRRSSEGVLRYRVRDVNHHSKTAGMTGYITASQKYVRPVYYATKHATITVINPRGVNAYHKADLTKKVTNYRQGTVLHVKRLVHHNLTTRYVLSNGHYITANRKLVAMGRHKPVKAVKTKRSINRYRNVNLTRKSRRIAKNKTLKVYGYDYTRGHELTKHGTLRYRVAGGYITANTKYVRAYK